MNTQTEVLLPLQKVEDMVGFKHVKIYALMKENKFPKSKRIAGKVLWRQAEIQEWIIDQWQKEA